MRSFVAGRFTFPSAILFTTVRQAIVFSPQRWLATRQWIHHRRTLTAALADQEAQGSTGPITATLPAESETSKAFSGFCKPRLSPVDQAQQDLGVKSRERRDREKHADQVAALLRSNLKVTREKNGSSPTVYGRNQQDKRLVNQLLKDKGQLSHDWRIPLLLLEQHYRSQNADAAAAPSAVTSEALIRPVYYKPDRQQIANLARDVSRPAVWSEETLFQFILDVAKTQDSQAKIPRVLKPQEKGWSNVADAVRIYEDIFYDAAMKKYLSAEACNMALQFFYKHGLISKARNLFQHMDSLKMQIRAETSNILLRGAASNKDLHNFTFLLHNTLKRGFSPNDETWLNLLLVVSSKEVRAVIRQKMEERRILENSYTKRDVAALMVPNEVDFHLGSGRDPHTFFCHMDSRYGTAWLTTGAGNSFLNEISKLRPVSDSLNLLQRMKQRGFVADEVTLNTLLHKYIPSRSRTDIVEILDFCDYHFRLRPGNSAYQTLLLQAWNGRLLNFARVIWRSACIDGCVTFKMRQLVFRSLLGHGAGKSLRSNQADATYVRMRRPSDLFNDVAGDFVVGLGDTQAFELGKAPWTSRNNPKATSVKMAKLLLDSDMLVAGTCHLKIRLPDLLRQASELDQQWLANKVYQTNDPQKLIQGGIQVEVDRSEIRLGKAGKIRKILQTSESPNELDDT